MHFAFRANSCDELPIVTETEVQHSILTYPLINKQLKEPMKKLWMLNLRRLHGRKLLNEVEQDKNVSAVH